MRTDDANVESRPDAAQSAPSIPPDAAALPVPGFEIDLAPEAEHIADALRSGDAASAGRVVKQEGDAMTWIGRIETSEASHEVVIKRLPHRRGLGGLFRRLMRQSRAERQCLGAARLIAIGVPTSEPLLLLRGRWEGRPADWLILRRLPGRDLLELLDAGGLTLAEEHETADAVGALLRRLHERGLTNRDAKLSNLVRTPEGDLGMIDTVGVRQGRPARDPLPSVERMMAPMLFEASGTGLLPRSALRYRCARAATDKPRKLWRGLERRLRLAGDTRPRHDPRNHTD